MTRLPIGGAVVDLVDARAVVEAVVARCRRPAPPAEPPLSVFSCNVDMVVKAERDPAFGALLRQGSLVTADGMPIVWLSRLLGAPLPERVTGADLVPAVCAVAAREGLRVFFFGAAPGVALRAAERLARKARGLEVAGVLAPPLGFERDPRALEEALAAVRSARPDVCFVALGAPKQEKLVIEHGAALGAKALLGIGGALDMAAGDVRRAPRAVQRAGAEWLWRLAQDPRRLARRYLVEDVAFARVAARELLGRARNR